MVASEDKSRLEEAHPVIQMIFARGHEVLAGLGGAIRTREEEEKAALNLTDCVEENMHKVDHYEYYDDPFTGQKMQAPIYAQEHRWRVNFGVEKDNRIEACMSVVLTDVVSEAQGLGELGQIAEDVQWAFNLPYTPRIFRDGEPYQVSSS